MSRKTEPTRQANHMCVHHHALVFLKGVAEYDIGCFPTYAWQRNEFFHRIGNATTEIFFQFLAASLNIFRLVPEKSCGAYCLLNLFQRGICKRCWIRKRLEKCACHLVHPFVGALRREDGGHEQLETVCMFQLALGIRVSTQEPSVDF